MRAIAYTILAVALAACGTDDVAPSAEIRQATPTTLEPANDAANDIRIALRYEDADGDLGEGTAQIHDCRAMALRTDLALPAIAADEMIGSKITGSLDLQLTDVGPGGADAMPDVCDELGVSALATNETVFCVVLVDADGNEGAGDCTPAISLVQ